MKKATAINNQLLKMENVIYILFNYQEITYDDYRLVDYGGIY